MSINKYKEKLNELTLQMQFFCLDPKWVVFQEICKHTKLKNEQGAKYDIWYNAVILTYGQKWVGKISPNQITQATKIFNREYSRIAAKLLMKPSAEFLDRIWFIFFATGEFEYLKKAFEVAGNRDASPHLKDVALNMYQTVKKSYAEKNGKQSVFDQLQTEIDKNTKRIEDNDIPELVGTLEPYHQPHVQDHIPKLPDSGIKSDLEKANQAFDTIADELFGLYKL